MPPPAHRIPALLWQTRAPAAARRPAPAPVRQPAPVEEDEEYEDSRDSVAEALIRWVPPITAILCAAIALCGFVYYQFVL